MTKNQRTINLLAIVAYLIVATVFFASVSLPFIALTAILIFTIILAKNDEDNRAIVPVTGAVALYFVVLVVDLIFSILNTMIDKIIEWVEPDEPITIFHEMFDIVLFFVTVGVIALCVLSVIFLLTGKDFRKSIVGMIVAPVVMGKAPTPVCPNCGSQIKGEFCAKCGTKKPE